MKKTVIGILVLLCMILQACSSTGKATVSKANSNANSVSQVSASASASASSSVSAGSSMPEKYTDGYLFSNGNYSVASGKKIYVSGKMIDTGEQDQKIYGLLKEPKTSKNWMIYLGDKKDVSKSVLSSVIGKSVDVYGQAQGMNGTEKFPVISTEKVVIDKSTYNLKDFLKAAESGHFVTKTNPVKSTPKSTKSAKK